MVPALVFVAAGLYFAVGIGLSLEWRDEGLIVYPIWRVAEGALPYRDFPHVYGPSLFWLNATLLRVFGTDLLVLRVALLLVKALAALLLYLVVCRAAPRRHALLATAILVVAWGAPWPIFNTPYANHYAATLSLAGLLLFLWLRGRAVLAGLAAGLCFGLASTFKQTSGAFALAALVCFLLHATPRTTRATPLAEDPGARRVERTWRALRLAVPVALAGLFAAYLAAHNTWWSGLALLFPFLASAGLLVLGELRGVLAPGAAWRSAREMLAAGLGFAVPLLGWGVYYAAAGALDDLLRDTLWGLPQQLLKHFFVPLPVPEPRTLLFAAAVAAILLAARRSPRKGRWRDPATLVALGLGAAVAFLLLREGLAAGGLRSYARGVDWYADLALLWFLFPLAVAWGSLLGILVPGGRGAALRGGAGEAAALLAFYAVVSPIFLYPVADLWHVLMALLGFLPALAVLLARFEGAPARAGRPLSAAPRSARAAVLLLSAALCAPFVHALVSERLSAPKPAFERASGISDPAPSYAEVSALVAHLRAQVPAEHRLLVTTGEPMIYFLADRRSALEPAEFYLPLRAKKIFRNLAIRRAVSQRELIAELERQWPVIVERADEDGSGPFRNAFPDAGAFIDRHYGTVALAGGYRVLERQEPGLLPQAR